MKTPIESLLNLKRWKEDEAKNQFAILLRELATEEKRLLHLEGQYKSFSKKLENTADELINIDEIRKTNEYLEHLLIRIQRQKEAIAAKETEVEDARKVLADASRDRKIFERLDEKQKDAAEKEFKRREQIGTDEHAITGHQRKKA
ncbi:MAG: flagellar export protein FliJ [Nitrospirae bacterium]|nr:flagellar export protein FliJ [Nitrospirota bacterium]